MPSNLCKVVFQLTDAPVISFPHNLQVNIFLLNPSKGSQYAHIESKALGILIFHTTMIQPGAKKKKNKFQIQAWTTNIVDGNIHWNLPPQKNAATNKTILDLA